MVMNIVSHNKKKIVIEINPLELEILTKATTQEARRHEYNWNNCVPLHPEEIMYFADMKMISEDMKKELSKLRKNTKS
jgi:hypothetical protein